MVSNFFNTSCYNWLWLFELDFQLCFIFVPTLLLYISWKHKECNICKYLFYGIQLVFLVCSILVAYYLKDTTYRNTTDFFFHE